MTEVRKTVANVLAFAISLFCLGVVLLLTAQPAEDSVFFNCHLHGNEVCGADEGLGGFVNLM